jgi:hypothetical protein
MYKTGAERADARSKILFVAARFVGDPLVALPTLPVASLNSSSRLVSRRYTNCGLESLPIGRCRPRVPGGSQHGITCKCNDGPDQQPKELRRARQRKDKLLLTREYFSDFHYREVVSVVIFHLMPTSVTEACGLRVVLSRVCCGTRFRRFL